MTAYISPIGNTQFIDANGNPLVGGKVYTYAAGTTTPIDAYTSQVGDVAQSNPAILNSMGALDSPLYLDQGVAYKIVIKDADDVATGMEYDYVYGSEEATAPSEWVRYKGEFSYLSSTQFSVVGDQTQVFQTNRHLKTLVTAGTAYHIVTGASYSAPDTTVTVTNTFLSLDTGLNQLYYGFFAPENSSIPESAIGTAIRTAEDQAAAQTALGVYSESEVDDAIAAASPPQLRSIAASVASNELTLTINPTKIDFRSTTLTDGTPTTVTLASANSIVVPSGATLGTTNSVSARLVLLAINNAGAIEAAVVNMAGGVNLDETGTINTTALGTGSDSANVVYSTTARTGVAYRVVGFIDISETTAGTWATAPTLVAGAGGEATQNMTDSQAWSDVTGSRAIGTTYYNTTGRKKIVLIRVRSTNNDEGATAVTVRFSVNGSTLDDAATAQWNDTKYIFSIRTLQYEVPAGQSYALTNQVGTSTLQSWREL